MAVPGSSIEPFNFGCRAPISIIWVAVKELKFSYHNGYIYILNNRVSPIW